MMNFQMIHQDAKVRTVRQASVWKTTITGHSGEEREVSEKEESS